MKKTYRVNIEVFVAVEDKSKAYQKAVTLLKKEIYGDLKITEEK